MKRYAWLVCMALALMLAAFAQGSGGGAASRFPGDTFVDGEILIGLRPDAEAALPNTKRLDDFKIATLDDLGRHYQVLSVSRVFDASAKADGLAVAAGLTRIFKVTVPRGTDIAAMVRAYAADPHVEFAEPNRILTIDTKVSDKGFKDQWGLNNTGQQSGTKDADIDAPEAWDRQRGSAGVVIAIIDTGVDYLHPDLKGGRVLASQGKDFANDDDDAMDDHGHGTYTAGIAAATTNNRLGIAGVCWNCRILPVKVLDADGHGSSETVAQGIEYAASQGARILSMSLGFTAGCGCSQTIARAINYAYERGSLLIAASGNDSDKEEVSYPAASPRVMAIGATDRKDQETDFSNRSDDLDLFAPGKDIFSLDRRQPGQPQYRTASGTSASTPFVSGVAALIWSAHPELTAGEVWQILRDSTDRRVRLYGGSGAPGNPDKAAPGRLNAANALKAEPGEAVAAAEDTCEGEPTDCPLGCAAEVAVAGTPGSWQSLAVLRRLRSEVLAPTPLGSEWVELYERHRLETARILLLDGDFRTTVRSALADWLPLFQAAIDRSETPVPVTARSAASMRSVIDGFRSRGSLGLQRDLDAVEEVLDERVLVVGKSQREIVQELAVP